MQTKPFFIGVLRLLLCFFILLAHDSVLVMQDGSQLHCDDYQRRAGLVLIRTPREIYSLPDNKVDWHRTKKLQVAQATQESQVDNRHIKDAQSRESQPSALPRFPIGKLDVKDASLIDVLRFLTDMAQLNLVIDPAVPDSRATYFLQDIPWHAAFELVLLQAGLDYQLLHGAVWIVD